MNRTFRYRLYPTRRQQTALNEMLVDHCDLYNAALQERRDAWQMTETSVGYAAQCKQLTEIRRADAQYRRWSHTSEQQTLRRLKVAFAAFYKRAKRGLGKRAGFPRFKSFRRFDTVTFVNGDGGTYRDVEQRVYMRGVGEVKVRQHRPIRGIIKQFSITRQGKRWFVNVMCVDVPRQERPPTGAVVGIDKGVNVLLADSDGGFVENPRHYAKAQTKLAAAQQDLARRKRGSNRRRKAAQRVATLHRKVANQRRDFLHKTSRTLVDTYDLIAAEDLKIVNMTKTAKGTVEQPGTNVAAKSGLNKSILDAGWGVLQEMLSYKAEDAGVNIILVDPRNTSRECHACEHIAAENRNGIVFRCVACGHADHADTNAAKNILRRGIRLRETAHAA